MRASIGRATDQLAKPPKTVQTHQPPPLFLWFVHAPSTHPLPGRQVCQNVKNIQHEYWYLNISALHAPRRHWHGGTSHRRHRRARRQPTVDGLAPTTPRPEPIVCVLEDVLTVHWARWWTCMHIKYGSTQLGLGLRLAGPGWLGLASACDDAPTAWTCQTAGRRRIFVPGWGARSGERTTLGQGGERTRRREERAWAGTVGWGKGGGRRRGRRRAQGAMWRLVVGWLVGRRWHDTWLRCGLDLTPYVSLMLTHPIRVPLGTHSSVSSLSTR